MKSIIDKGSVMSAPERSSSTSRVPNSAETTAFSQSQQKPSSTTSNKYVRVWNLAIEIPIEYYYCFYRIAYEDLGKKIAHLETENIRLHQILASVIFIFSVFS